PGGDEAGGSAGGGGAAAGGDQGEQVRPAVPAGRAGQAGAGVAGAVAVSRAASNVEDVIDVDAPTGDGGLGVGHASAAEDDRRLAGAVGRDGLGERIDVPDDERAGLEIVGALGGVLPISARVIIVLIADLHRQGGRIWDVAHSVGRVWPVVVRSIGRE